MVVTAEQLDHKATYTMASISSAVAERRLKLHLVFSLQISGLVCRVSDVVAVGDQAADSKVMQSQTAMIGNAHMAA